MLLRPLTVLLPALLLTLSLQTPVAAKDKPKSPDDVICKTDAKTGTRFRTRDCRTRAQWEAQAEQQMRDAKEMIDRPVIETRSE